MKNSIELNNLKKAPLLLAITAVFALAGCSSQPAPRYSDRDYTGPTGAQGATGAVGEQGSMGETGVALSGPAGKELPATRVREARWHLAARVIPARPVQPVRKAQPAQRVHRA